VSLITQQMQREMHEIQCAVAMRDRNVRTYVSKSFAAVPYLVEAGHLTTRKEVQNFVEMVKATTDAYINTR
jgi:hypothetical protein